MRSDIALYAVAIVFFILTGVVVAYSVEQQLWIVTSTVLGLIFIGLGYTQRPKQTTSTTPTVATQTTTPPPPPTQTAAIQVEHKVEQAAPEPLAAPVGLTQVKGIKEKRAEQLRAIGITRVEDLANASANDLAAKLKISPKITGKWVENAKELAKKP